MSVNGAVWNVGEADNISIGSDENQTISGIETRNSNGDVKIRIGDLVERGAELDRSNSSYTIDDQEEVANSDVYIKNPGKNNATVVVDQSIPDGSGFNITISNIDTKNISMYNDGLSDSDMDIDYSIEQGISKKYVQFTIQSPAEVSFQNEAYSSRTGAVSLEKLELVNETNYVIIWERSKGGELIQQLGISQGKEGEVNITNENITRETELAVTIHPGKEKSDMNVIYAADSQSVRFPVSIKAAQKPIHYVNNSLEQSNVSSVLSIPFNTKISSEEGNISVEFFDRSQLTIDLRDDNEHYRIDGKSIDILLNGTASESSGEYPYIKNISTTNLKSENYESRHSKTRYVPRRVGHTVENETNVTVVRGTYVGLNLNESTTISLSSEGPDIQQNPVYKYKSIRVINTSILSEGEYIIQAEEEEHINRTQLNIMNESFSPDVPTTSVKNNIVINNTSTLSTREIAANIRKNSELMRSKFTIDASDTHRNIINISEGGEYKIEFVDMKTGETSNETVVVLEEDLVSEIPVSTESIFSGQVIPIEISSTYSTSLIHINDADTNTTAATIELETPEEGQTTLGFNTYAAANGSLNESVTVTGSGASIESVTTPEGDGTISPGTYEIAVRSEQGIATTSDNATVSIARRSTNGLATYAGPEAERSDLESAAAVRDAIEADTLSRTERVGANDTVVYAVNASGLTGLTDARSVTPETGADLDRLDGLGFGVRSTGDGGELTASDARGETPRDATVHVDETGLYVVADADGALPTDGDPEPDEEFTAEFRVTDDHLREAAADPPDGHRVTSTVAFDGEDRDDPPGDDRQRAAPGVPDRGGGGNGTGGGGGDRGGDRSGGTGGTGGATGGAPDGATPAGPAGGDRSNGPNAGSATGTDGNDDRSSSGKGVGVGARPNAERRVPLLDGPVAVSTSTRDRDIGASGALEAANGDSASASHRAAGDGAESEAMADAEGGIDDAETDTADPDRATPTYENAPIRTTAEDVPGFGPLHALLALSLALLVATRRVRGR